MAEGHLCFPNVFQTLYFLHAANLYIFDNYVIITWVVLKLVCYQSWLLVLSEITVFGTTLKRSESVPMHMEETEIITCAGRLLLHTAYSAAALNKRVTKEESLSKFCFSVQKLRLSGTSLFLKDWALHERKVQLSTQSFTYGLTGFEKKNKNLLGSLWNWRELLFVLYVPFLCLVQAHRQFVSPKLCLAMPH